ncbi:hypothetical protein B0O99DRAFT_579085 [Bisporella sp. PMI_857]|nr:hypothetical protein B0O99DRAFT_579085 [Bisporella sp. PMI_857]
MASAISFGNRNTGLQAGIINGPVNTEIHHYAPGNRTPERLETPPNPTIIIPFSRDTDFVERGEVLDNIHQRCAVSGSRTALVGLGGVGKSQLAIEYAYRTRERSPKTWVFWVHASNAARFKQGFRDIANYVNIPGWQNPTADIFQLVHDWLRDDRKGEWVLILDNVDDAGFLVEARNTNQAEQINSIDIGYLKPLLSYLPQCPNGSILITTRSKITALKLVEQKNIIAIEPMSRADALSLLKNKLEGYENGDDAAELIAALEFMPLAIVQAAANITQRAPRYSVRQYLHDFRKSDRKRTSLLNYEGGQLRRDQEAKNSIILTWQISFDHIRKIRPSAADLLSLMSFFDRQGIPEALLRRESGQKNSRRDQKASNDDNHVNSDANNSSGDEDNTSQSSMSDEFEEDALTLRNYSFISINAKDETFEMHGLVQLATRKWLEAYGQREKWKQHFIRKLYAELPAGEYEDWATCQALFPHVQSAAAQKPEEQDSLRDWASIMYNTAWYAWRIGFGVEAENMSVEAMKVRKRILGREHNDTLDSMAMVGLAYRLRARWDDAEKLFVQVIETHKKKLGVDHPDTLISMANLASTYRNQGRWDAAEELEVQVMEARKMKLGMDHLDTLTSMFNLALTFWNQGRWDAAEELEVQVMEARKKKLGVDHPDTLSIMGNLASTFWNQGRWDAAEELEVQAMEARIKKLGVGHPDTLTSMGNLASTFWSQGRWDAAEELEVQVMEARIKKLGMDHPNTLTSVFNLALTFWNQGRWDAAEELEVQVMEARKKKLGVDHPHTLSSMHNLAFTWKGTGKEVEAVILMEECVQSRKRVLGLNHPDTLSSCTALTDWKAGPARGHYNDSLKDYG